MPAPVIAQRRSLGPPGVEALTFTPEGAAPFAALVVPALGMPSRRYAAFAETLAGAGIATWVPRVAGEHTARRLGLDAISLIAERFLEQFGSATRVAIAHSVGGALFGLLPSNQAFDRALLVCAPWAPLSSFRGAAWVKVGVCAHVLVPLLTAAGLGFSGRLLGVPGSVPAELASTLSGCVRERRYVQGSAEFRNEADNFARFRGALAAVVVERDPLASPAQAAALAEAFTQARSRQLLHLKLATPDPHRAFFDVSSASRWREVAMPFLTGA